MSSNVDVPYTRRNVSALSQRSNNANARTPRPIDESMVRERLSVNLPDSFHYLSNTLPMGRHRTRSSLHRRHSSSSSSSSSRRSNGNNEDSTRLSVDSGADGVAAAEQGTGVDAQTRAEQRSRRNRVSPPHSSRSSASDHSSNRNSSSQRSSSSSSTSSDDSDRCDDDDDYTFYARLAKLDRSGRHDSRGGEMRDGVPLVAQCCDTVRGTIDLLDTVHVSPYDAEDRDKFFWLDLHGVPPPLPGSPQWGKRPRRWQKRQLAALRATTQAVEHGGRGGGVAPEVELRALWTALGLQDSTIQTLTTVCQQRQLNPRPDRTSLDDVYEEEVVDLAYPDDRILQVAPLSTTSGDGAYPASAEPTAAETRREAAESSENRVGPPGSCTARLGTTHYVLMELATLLTCIPATTAKGTTAAWSSTFLTRVGSYTFATEPLNDAVWTETMGRSMHIPPTGYRAATASAAARRRGQRGGRNDGRQLTAAAFYSVELPVTPLITSTYVLCFPGGCVTWCPGSTLGLTSPARREQRLAAAQERRQQRRRQRHRSHHHSDNDDAGEEREEEGRNAEGTTPSAPHRSGTSSSSDSDDSDIDDGVEVQYVKSWEQLQASVFHRLRHMAAHGDTGALGTTAAPALSTSGFVSLLLSAVCYAYLPNTTAVLGEVDAIDSMLPLVGLNVESDQADALRRVLLLRRRLAVHRRLLFQKTRLLEALDRPALHTIARFVRTVKAPSWVQRAAQASSAVGSTRGTTTSEGHHRDTDTDSLSATLTPQAGDHPAGGFLTAASGTVEQKTAAMVHFVDTTAEEVPWSLRTAEQTYGGGGDGGNEAGSKEVSTTCFPAVEGGGGQTGNHRGSGGLYAGRSPPPHMAEPPSLNAIHKGIANVLRNLEVARAVLGNTTLIYSSTVNFNNSRSSESADYFSLICQYMLLIVLPLNIVASQWGMNCQVPFRHLDSIVPFWSLVGIMIFLAILGLAVPLYAYRTGRINMIS